VARIENDHSRYFKAAQAALAGLTNPLTLDTDPDQAAPWAELVRAAAADSFLVSPMQHDREVVAATFDATGARVVTASWDRTARIWDAGIVEPIGKLQHDGTVYAAEWGVQARLRIGQGFSHAPEDTRIPPKPRWAEGAGATRSAAAKIA
jgi:WD40 repeat protein